VIVVEAAEYKPGFRQTGLLPRRRSRCDTTLAVVDLVAVRQVHDLLGIERLLVERQHGRIDDDIVKKIRADGPGETEIPDLDRGRAMREDDGPRILCVALEVDGYVDFVIAQRHCDLAITLVAHVMKGVERPLEPARNVTVAGRAKRHADHL